MAISKPTIVRARFFIPAGLGLKRDLFFIFLIFYNKTDNFTKSYRQEIIKIGKLTGMKGLRKGKKGIADQRENPSGKPENVRK